MTEKTNIEEINELLIWYDNNSTKHISINYFLDFQDKLAIRSYRLAEELAEIKREYNLKYFMRKIEFNKSKKHYIDDGKSGVQAEAEANLEVEKLQKAETDWESVGFRLEQLLRQINRILQAIQQRISFMKYEMQRTDSQQTT